MQPDRFEKAVSVLLMLEGGYVNNPDDPGGETKHGVSKRTYPTIDIAGLSEADARAIYRHDWWDKYGYERLRAPLGEILFLLAVNMGPIPAHSLLQRALSDVGLPVAVDGILGPMTIKATYEYRYPDVLALLVRSGAIERYRRLEKPKFLAGWTRRAMT